MFATFFYFNMNGRAIQKTLEPALVARWVVQLEFKVDYMG